MKKVILLTTLLIAVRASAAISFFDPFADATASGGTSYTATSALAVGTVPAQTNAFGVAWFCLSNTFPNNLGVPVITNDNLSYPGLGTSTGNAVFIPPQAGNMGRVSVVSGLPTSNQWYYSFMLKVTDISTLTSSTTTNFFAALTDTTGNAKTFLLRAQSYLVAKKSGAGYVLGIGKNKPLSAQIAYDTTVRNVGDTLFVVAAYDYIAANHPASLWINPGSLGAAIVPGATVSITTGTELNTPGVAGFALGGYTNTAPPGCVVDDVRVSTNWAVVTGLPEMETQPAASQSKNAGDAASMTVLAMGGSLSYQWQRNGVNVSNDGNISGATGATLAIASVSQATAGSYTVIVTSPVGSVTSSTSVLAVTDPYISSQPANAVLSPGDNATFSITAQGAAPLSYQWYKGANLLSNGGNISGAATSALAVGSIGLGDVGSYSCYVTNGLGSVLQSSTATLNVSDPAITSQPQNATGNYGTAATFSVSAVGSSPITYQWFHGATSLSNGGNISGSQSAALTVSAMSYTDNGSYSVIVTSPGGTATSSAATLSVVEPIITGQPASATVAATSNATFSVTAIGVAPFTYQWKKNGSNLSDGGNVSGSQMSALTLSAVSATDAASYTVLVGDASGTNVLSGAAILTVLNPPSITAQPNSRRIVVGNKAAVAVSASGATPFSYQWLLNGGPISGATGSSYSIASVQVSDDGSYSVIVSNSVGAATSSAATLDVVASIRLYNTNLVVLRAGDGAQTQTLNGNSVFLDQYDQSGNYVGTISIPDSGASALIEMGLDQNGSTLTGSALSHSGNDRYLVLAGYNTAAPYSGNLQTSTSVAVPRAIGIVDTYGQYTLAIADTNAYNGTYFRGAAFDGINNFWGAGNAGGTYYFGLDAAAVTNQVAFQNLRSVDIFNGNLYTVSGSGTGTGILKWSGRPTTATAATTLFVPAAVPSDISVDSTGTNIYVGTSSGVAKYQFDGTTWTLVYTLGTGPVRYVAVDYSGAAPVIYATTTDSSFNRIVTVTDTNASATVTTFATAGLNQTFRGIRFGPVATPASVTSQPANQTSATGGSVVFSGVVAGDTPLIYQWYKGAVALANGTTGSGSVVTGAMAANLTVANISAADQDSYSFIVSNAHSSATSSSATLTVIDPVVINTGLSDQTNNAGTTATFSVIATGSTPFSFQWQRGTNILSDGGNVYGSTTSSLTLSNVLAADAASYTVTVGNQGTSASSTATLTVIDPVINTQPVGASIQTGQTAIFSVDAAGTALTYQWRKGGIDLADGLQVSGATVTGATLVSLTVANSTVADTGNYSVVVTGSNGSVTSSDAALSVTNATVAVTITDSVIATPSVLVADGTNVTLSVGTTGSDPKTYQWYVKDFADAGAGTLVASGASNQVVVAAEAIRRDKTTATNVYYVIVDNAANAPQTSTNAKVTIVVDNKSPAPLVLTSPAKNGKYGSGTPTLPFKPYAITGTATDPAKGHIAHVKYYYINSNTPPFVPSAIYEAPLVDKNAGTTGDSIVLFNITTNPPLAGTNLIAIWPVDLAGNPGKGVTNAFFYQVQIPFTLHKVGDGTGAVSFVDKMGDKVNTSNIVYFGVGTVDKTVNMNEGETYTLSYTPDRTTNNVKNLPSVISVVTNAPGWGGPTNSIKKYTGPAITVEPTTNSVSFEFDRDRFVDMAGNYNAVLTADTNNPTLGTSRYLHLTVAKSRVATGYLMDAAHVHDAFAVHSSVDSAGHLHLQTALNSIVIDGDLAWTGSENPTGIKQFTGSVTFVNTSNAVVVADLEDKNALPTPGFATMSIPGVNNNPGGSGIATHKLLNGSVTSIYTLGDDDKHPATWPLKGSRSGNIPQWIITKTGVLFGNMNATDGLSNVIAPSLSWIRNPTPVLGYTYANLLPGGFVNSPFAAVASHYDNSVHPGLTGAFTLSLSGGGLANDTNTTLIFSGNTFTTNAPSPVTGGKVDPVSGKLTVIFLDGLPSKHKTTALGVVLQNATNGAGFFIRGATTIPTNSGSLTLTPQ